MKCSSGVFCLFILGVCQKIVSNHLIKKKKKEQNGKYDSKIHILNQLEQLRFATKTVWNEIYLAGWDLNT